MGGTKPWTASRDSQLPCQCSTDEALGPGENPSPHGCSCASSAWWGRIHPPTFTASHTATSGRQNSTRGHTRTLVSFSPKINYQTVQTDKTTISTLWNSSKSSNEPRSVCAERCRAQARAVGGHSPGAGAAPTPPPSGGPAAAAPHVEGNRTVWSSG